MKQLLKGGRVLDPSQNLDDVRDVLIENGRILAIDANISEDGADEVWTLNDNQWVAPGLIDVHVHLRDPGQEYKETIESGTEAAIHGGFTAVACMPNTDPVIDNLSTLEYVKHRAQSTARIPVYPICAGTKNIAGEQITEIGELLKHGAVGFSDDGHCVMNARVMRMIFEYTAMFDVPFISHAEDTNLSHKGCMNEGYYSTLLGLQGIPNESESVIVARDIQLVKKTGARLHVAHVSARESVDLIRRAKEEGLNVTCEVTPHHLAQTDAAITEYDPDFKMNPPLRSEEDRQVMVQALKDGVIDAVATDHAPHSPDEKANPFDCCPNGVIGLETSLGVMMTHFVNTGLISPLTLIDRMSTGPARCLSLEGGTLKPGSRADITVIDPELAWVVDPRQFKSKSRNASFKGQTLSGKAVMVMSNGKVLMKDELFALTAMNTREMSRV